MTQELISSTINFVDAIMNIGLKVVAFVIIWQVGISLATALNAFADALDGEEE